MSFLSSYVLGLWLLQVGFGTPSVKTHLGLVHGNFDQKSEVSSYKGIPYAKAPVGDGRFAAPQSWTDAYPASGFNAVSFGSQCVSAAQPGEEDGLFLNIYVPTSNTSTPMPVLVFIHGGAFVGGSGSLYDGTNLAMKHGAIIVTMNYRLGAFGWVQVANGSGNFGLKDQREALRFLRRSTNGVSYIGAFGGDTDRMIIFGESAGAISVLLHLVSPGSQGLYSGALFESGMLAAKIPELALAQGSSFARAARCDTSPDVIACLRSKDTSVIRFADGVVVPPLEDPFIASWGPTVDQLEIPDDPYKLFIEGKHAHVPVVGGSNTDEGIMFVRPFYALGMSADAYRKFVRKFLSNGRIFNQTLYDLVLKEYPPSSENVATASRLIADATFVCGARYVVQHMAEGFLYHFAYRGLMNESPHGAELSFVFDYAGKRAGHESLAEIMGDLWVSFARTGRPGSEEQWPKYSLARDENIVFDILDSKPMLTIETGRRAKYCDFWMGSYTRGGFSLPSLGRVEGFSLPSQEAFVVV